jgi:flagellar FliJ protein
MSRAKRIEPVQDIAEDKEKKLAVSVVAFERRVTEAETKLQELERYRLEYQQQYATRAARGMGVTDLRDYQAFLARLNEAVKQQQALVQRAGDERDAERRRWQEAARKAKALDHVIDKWKTEERRVADKREQRDSDEFAQRAPREDLPK